MVRWVIGSTRHGESIELFLKADNQVRSECLTCTFRANCCSARLSWEQVPAFFDSFVRDREKKGGGPPALVGTRE